METLTIGLSGVDPFRLGSGDSPAQWLETASDMTECRSLSTSVYFFAPLLFG